MGIGGAVFTSGVADGLLTCYKTKVAQREVLAQIRKHEQQDEKSGFYNDLTLEEKIAKTSEEFNDRMQEKAPTTYRVMLDFITEWGGGGLLYTAVRNDLQTGGRQ